MKGNLCNKNEKLLQQFTITTSDFRAALIMMFRAVVAYSLYNQALLS